MAVDPVGAALAAVAATFLGLSAFSLLHARGASSVRAFGVASLGIALVLVAFSAWRLLGVVSFAAEAGPLWPLGILAVAALLLPIGFTWLALVSPRPVEAADRRALGLACLAAAATFALIGLDQIDVLLEVRAFDLAEAALRAVTIAGYPAVFGTLVGALVLLALRARRAVGGTRDYTLLSSGLVLFYTADQADLVLDGARGAEVASAVAAAGGILLVALLWLRNAAVAATKADAAGARNVALLTLGSAVAAMLVTSQVDAGAAYVLIGAGFAVFAYAIFRHQMLGLDVKVRWGLSRGTVAAAFVAVFFVASEGTQVLFGADDPWIGVAAAGALVFALAPLQRLGDRLAERAVPLAAGPPADRGEEETYRVTVRKYLADGTLSRDEERHLARLATRLGIDAERAHALRDEIEAERPR